MLRTARARPTRPGPAALVLAAAALAGALALIAGRAHAAPDEYVPVGDPIESELRILDLLDSRGLHGRIRLPHLGLRPLQRFELQGRGAPVDSPDVVRAISLARLERALGRDAAAGFAPHPRWRSTPRLLQVVSPGEQRLEVSAGVEGAAEADTGHTRFDSGSGMHARLGVQVDRWLFFSHLLVGQVDQARSFADPILPKNDVIAYTDETYLAYDDREGRWGMQFGRSRWNWGPGEEGTLILSRTAAPITGLSYQVHLGSLHLDGSALSATLRQAAGEQLAAHRIEWQPTDGLRLGLTEAARYKAGSWQPLYAVGVIPYILVQRLLVQDEPDSSGALRNNVMVGLDAAWRIADGTRVYGELLIDDLHARSGATPNKYGWQVGWEGVGAVGATRVSWGGELTRITRYTYTSYFGRDFQAQGRPLGFPTGPDARRVALRAAWDLGPDWQLFSRASRTDKGENELDDPFVPGSPRVTVETFQGVVEQTRDAAAGLRWWPASGVDLSLSGGWVWIDNLGHQAGLSRDGAQAALEVRLVR